MDLIAEFKQRRPWAEMLQCPRKRAEPGFDSWELSSNREMDGSCWTLQRLLTVQAESVPTSWPRTWEPPCHLDSVPLKKPSSQGNQHWKGTVQELNRKMDMPTKAAKVQAGDLSLQKCPWHLSTENTALAGTETGPQQNLTRTRPNTSGIFQKATHPGLPQVHPDPLPSSGDAVPPGIEFLDLQMPKFTAFL